MRFPAKLIIIVSASLLFVQTTACATSSSSRATHQDDTVQESHLDVDPMLIRVRDGSSTETETIDVQELFALAYEAFQNRRHEEATDHYALIIKYFPTTRYYLPALYNSGLAFESLQRWDDAIRVYQIIISTFPDNKEAIDTYYRLANVHHEIEDYEKVVDLMTEIMLRPLNNFDRVEAHVRRSNALVELGHLDDAEQGYRTLLRLNERARAEEQLAERSHFLVQTHFGLGRIFHARVASIPLVLPPERMKEDLEKKGEWLLHAQGNYIRALRQHHPHWSVAAGYMIGRLYEDFYTDILMAEIPDDLSDDHIAMYFEELHKQIKPLMERAISVYERNLSLSQRIVASEEANLWVEQTAVHLDRLRTYLDDPNTRMRAQRLVLQGRNVSELWNPQQFASDTINDAVSSAVTEIQVEAAVEQLEIDDELEPDI